MVDPDVLNVADTPSDRVPHIASPDVHADGARRRFVMYFHGMVPESVGGHLPCWMAYPSVNQKTMVAVASTGRGFVPVEPVVAVAPSYLRMFDRGDAWYGVAMPSQVVRSADGLSDFEYGPMLFDDEIRHCCVTYCGEHAKIEMLFTRCYEAPECIYRSMIDASDWRTWTPGPVTELLRPTEDCEGASEASSQCREAWPWAPRMACGIRASSKTTTAAAGSSTPQPGRTRWESPRSPERRSPIHTTEPHHPKSPPRIAEVVGNRDGALGNRASDEEFRMERLTAVRLVPLLGAHGFLP